ncbi:XrtB/PEP-CTERM-associated polysaccharide biosynthesis outer membrane protein EpsL [Methylocaldum szegediense]|uniref:XrtB/PEP-CTERM-associated polysaccharide biosynthesis outer membrane protein EpsL n=1 Tax=Methylocaldum szegediense TaxID=73780 RepID=UPI0004069AE6|nr:XrtB/PEP-CTERM-associated polysaccharide biosynthesis outer membrane protein EpsL [Methylocaldum szegediense]
MAYLLSWQAEVYSAADTTDTWRLNFSESIGYDDNLFRLSDNKDSLARLLPSGASKTDVINRFSVEGLINYKVSRQRFLLDFRVDDNRFIRNDKLNNLSANAKAALEWQIGKYLSGDIGYRYRRYLGAFTNTVFFGKDMVTENIAYLNSRISWDPNWRIHAGIQWAKAAHGAEERSSWDSQSIGVSIGLDYISTSKNVTGLEYRLTEADFPNTELSQDTQIDNHYMEQSVGASLSWQIFKKVRLDGRIGYTIRNHRTFSSRNFSGEIWRISVDWEPTAKTRINLAGWRDLLSAPDLTATYIIDEGISLSPSWSVTKKIALSGKIYYETQDYAGDPGLIKGISVRRDEIFGGQITVHYMPRQNAEVSLSYRAEERSSNRLFADYVYSSIFASATFRF